MKKRLFFSLFLTFVLSLVFILASVRSGNTIDVRDILGKWKQTVGSELEIKSVSNNGNVIYTFHDPVRKSMELGGFRPASRGEVLLFKGRPRIYLEFSTGDFYDLVYEYGELRGVHYHAQQKRIGYWVKFYRPEHEVNTTVIDGVVLPKEVKIFLQKENTSSDAGFYLGYWKGSLGRLNMVTVITDIKPNFEVEGIIGLRMPGIGPYFHTSYFTVKGRLSGERAILEHLFPEYTLILEKRDEKIKAYYHRSSYERGEIRSPSARWDGILERFTPGN